MERVLPALAEQALEITEAWSVAKLRMPTVQAIRLCATEDCMVSCGFSEAVEDGGIALVAGYPEWFTVARGRNVYLAVRAIPDDKA